VKQVVIENPVINSPFEEPKRHFRFTDEGITNEIIGVRRRSSYFIPIARPKKRGKQLLLDTEWTQDRVEENRFVNQIRARLEKWRLAGRPGSTITKVTARLFDYWSNPEREKPLFFCQIEAVETAVYLTEVAAKYGDAWIENDLRRANEDANPLLFRTAFKMATGTGKTVVMAMLIAWHALNKLANPQDARFSDTFLIVTPGIPVRDRLRVLLPNDPQNYYHERDLLPPEMMEELQKAKIIITNFHGFKPRERVQAGKLTKQILKKGSGNNGFTETPDEMVRRVCRELGAKRNIVVINDEAHHCYRHRVVEVEENLTREERREAEERDEEARIWISGLEAVKAKIGTIHPRIIKGT
jgi:type III restriction enzyme